MSSDIIFLFICILISLSYEENNDNIVNISSLKDFSSLMSKQHDAKSILLLIYKNNSTDSISFMSKFEELAKKYKGSNIIFVRIEGSNKEIYDSFIYVSFYPTLYLFNRNKFILYDNKTLEIDQIELFIKEKINFGCKELQNIKEFEEFIASNNIRDSYILGVFDNKNNSDKESVIKSFNWLNTENRNYIDNDECYIYFINQKDKENKSNLSLYTNEFIKNNNTKITVYNNQRGYTSFNGFDIEIVLKYVNNQNDPYIRELKESYGEFIDTYLYPLYIIYDKEKLTQIYNRNKNYIIFSYNSKEEFDYFDSLCKRIITSIDYDKNYIILNINISNITTEHNKDDKQLSFEDEFTFMKEKGIYFSGKRFKNIQKFLFKEENTSLKDKYSYSMFIKQFNEHKVIRDKPKDKRISQIEESFKNDHKKEQTQKMQEVVVTEIITNEEIISSKVIILPLYLIIYTIGFIYIYRKYCLNIGDTIENNQNTIKTI